ncbi:MAG TPA: DUF58 domain-containing protein [Kineosporiaceae bacterium]
MRSLLAWLRPALSGLTTRGRSFLAAGIASAACSIVVGQRDLLRVAALLITLPIGCALVLGRARYRLALTRTITPGHVVAGGTARVRLELENVTRLSTRVLLAEDRVPLSLGVSPRFVLARLPGGTRAAVTYSVRSLVRGRYPIGPVRLRLADPFGMCEVTRSFTATDPLVVVPRTWPLPPVRGGGLWAGTGESIARSAAASGEDDIATREYRHGDDLRRVHWRSTARRGELMVRREEQPRQMRATVLLDNRRDGHRGEGAQSSLEWAVSVAASAAVSLGSQRYGVRLLLDGQPATWISPFSGDGAARLLDELAVAAPGGPQVLAGAVSTLGRTSGDGLVVVVLGEVDDDVAGALARLVGRGALGVALLARTTEWATLSPDRAAEVDAARARVAATLRSAGWGVAEAGPRDAVPAAWAAALGLPDPVGPVVTSGPAAAPAAPSPAAPSPAPPGAAPPGAAPPGPMLVNGSRGEPR